MVWIYFQGSEASHSHSTHTSNLLHTAKSNPTAKASSCKECKKGICPLHQFGTTYEHYEEAICQKSTSLQEASHARIFLLQELARVWKESEADYFSRSCAWPKKRDPHTYSLKTSLPSLGEGVFESLKKLPRWGMIADGVLYPLHPLEPYIDEKGGSYWLTPSTMEHLPVREGEALERALHRGNSTSRRRVSGRLSEQVMYPEMFPTPTTQEVEHPNLKLKNGRRIASNGNTHSLCLADVVQMFPTPAARDWKDNGEAPSEIRRHTPGLACAVKLLPTPNASDAHNANMKDGHDLKKGYLRGVVFATPRASQAAKTIRAPCASVASGKHGECTQDSIGRLNPEYIGKKLSVPFVESMMAYPIGWSGLSPLETLLYPSKLDKHLKF